MRNYQSVLILKPDLDEAQVEESVNKITAILKKFGGSVLKLEKWGKKRLAYRVRKTNSDIISICTIPVSRAGFPISRKNISFMT